VNIRYAVCWVLATVVSPDPEVRSRGGVKCHNEYASTRRDFRISVYHCLPSKK